MFLGTHDNRSTLEEATSHSIHMVGQGRLVPLATEEVRDINKLLKDSDSLQASHVQVYYKAIIKGKLFFSKDYAREKKRNSYTISFSEQPAASPCYAFIEKFISVNEEKLVLIQELSIICRGPPDGVSDSVATTSSQTLLFEDYLTYTEGARKCIFAHQIMNKCCNLTNCGWKLFTPLVNDVELE